MFLPNWRGLVMPEHTDEQATLKMAPSQDPLTPPTPTVIYDDDCPFCRNYVGMLRFREAVGPVTLQDARDGGPVVEALTDAGYNLDDGMVLLINGEVHHGADAMTRMALLSSDSSLFNRLNAAIFRHPRLSRVLYPVLRTGRNVTLHLLGRTPLQERTPRLRFSQYRIWILVLALAIPAYMAAAHPKRMPMLNQMANGSSEIFPFFNWSLFSGAKSYGLRYSVRVLDAAPGSAADGHLGEVLAVGDAGFTRNIRFIKTLRGFSDPSLSANEVRLTTAVAQASNYLRPIGVQEFEVVVEIFDPFDPTNIHDLHTVSGPYPVTAPVPQG